jgi:hypothetical protein
MTVHFAFSDESGNYKQNRNIRFNQLHPYYIRASFIIDGDNWIYLDYRFRELKDEFQIPHQLEIKYSDIWTVIKHDENPSRKVDPRVQPILGYPFEMLIDFIEESIKLLYELEYASSIITISKNDSFGTIDERNIYTWHLQNLMQRIQKVHQDDDNLCLIFIDPVSDRVNKLLTNAYNNLFLNGDYFTQFSTIKDCLHFEYSHHSCGIQIADFIAGVTFGYLQGRQYSVDMFNRQIRPLILQCENGKTMGCGIIEIPTDSKVRRYLSNQFGV